MITDSKYYPQVLQVVAGQGFEIFVYFDDGSIHRLDVEPLLGGEVFAPLRDPARFRQRLTVIGGTVAWDLAGDRSPERCVDLDPITLYRDTEEVDEPAFLKPAEASTPRQQR